MYNQKEITERINEEQTNSLEHLRKKILKRTQKQFDYNKIKNKKLRRKFTCIYQKLCLAYKGDLQFQSQDIETQHHLYASIDELKRFLDNIS